MPQSWIRREETRLCDGPSRRWRGEKTRLDDFLTRTRIRDEWDDVDWPKEGGVSSYSHYERMIKGTQVQKDKQGLGIRLMEVRDNWLGKLNPG